MKAKIIEILNSHPEGIKAKKISTILGCTRKEVNSFLYSNLGTFKIDSQYYWYLIQPEAAEYGISFEDFVVRSNVFRCNKNHELETINALISVLHYNGEIVNETVTAGYCKHCNCYFILEQDYANLRRNGLPLCRQVTEKYYRENGDATFDGSALNEQSILNQIGYNVNATEDLSSKQRQDVLSFAVDSGLYTVNSICSFLDWLIDKNMRVTNRDMNDAISKWVEDREYISKYKSGSRPMKGVRSLKGRSVQ